MATMAITTRSSIRVKPKFASGFPERNRFPLLAELAPACVSQFEIKGICGDLSLLFFAVNANDCANFCVCQPIFGYFLRKA